VLSFFDFTPPTTNFSFLLLLAIMNTITMEKRRHIAAQQLCFVLESVYQYTGNKYDSKVGNFIESNVCLDIYFIGFLRFLRIYFKILVMLIS